MGAMMEVQPEMTGRVIGSYRVGELLGRGGMGHVYLARHLTLPREVAIKFLAPQWRQDDRFVARFFGEAQHMARLEHPNLARILDYGQTAGAPYLVMERLRGKSLEEALRLGPLPEAEAVRIAAAALSGLEATHAQQIIHRDIKPGNIFLCEDGTVKLVDFGIARAASEGRMTETGTLVGTAEYMSPEQAQGEAVDARSDLYSLGIVLREMLTGQVPFSGENSLVVLHQQVRKAPPPLPGSVSPWLRRIVERALAKAPRARFQSAAEMRATLLAGADDRRQTERRRMRARWCAAVLTTACLSAAIAGGISSHEQLLHRQAMERTKRQAAQLADEAFQMATHHQLTQAQSCAQQAVALDPRNANAHAALGTTLAEQAADSTNPSPNHDPLSSLFAPPAPDISAADAELQKALGLDAGNSRALAGHGRLVLVQIQRGTLRSDAAQAAEHDLETATQSEPGLAYGHRVLGLVELEEGWDDLGESHLQRALSLDPGIAHVHAELAALYLRQSQRTGRRELCRQAETEAEAEMASYAGDAGAERILQQARRLALSQLIASLSRPAPSPQLPAWLRPAPRILPSPLLPPVHRFDPASLQPAPRFRRPFWFPTAHSAFIPPAEPAWRRYRELFPIAGRSFSFLMPAAPRRELPQKNYERWDCTVEGTRYSVTHWKITDHGGDARTVLEGLGRSWKRCQLFFERPITLDGFTPGREMKYTIMPAAEQHAQAAWTRYYAAGESLYRIAVYVPAGTGWPGDAEKFLDSFRFE